jgi:CopG family nickel-responsive transcriptional regulator
MLHIDRFSVSLDTELLAAFDRHIASKGYQNRSEAIRDMIRDSLVTSRRLEGDEPITAILTTVCDHRVGESAARLRACLAAHADIVLGSVYVNVDDHRDALAITLKGPAEMVQTPFWGAPWKNSRTTVHDCANRGTVAFGSTRRRWRVDAVTPRPPQPRVH